MATIINGTLAGKTTLFSKVVGVIGESTKDSTPTVSGDCATFCLDIEETKHYLQVWDTAGQEKFRGITASFYRGVIGVILMYDVSNEESFSNIAGWLSDIHRLANENVEVVVVGNKCDIVSEKQVTYTCGENFAQNNGLRFFETSGKESINIEDPFSCVAELVLSRNHASKSKHAPPRRASSSLETSGKKSPKLMKKAGTCSIQ